jgi:hypothetical protein
MSCLLDPAFGAPANDAKTGLLGWPQDQGMNRRIHPPATFTKRSVSSL